MQSFPESTGTEIHFHRFGRSQRNNNPLTVAKAYQGFQDEGLVTVRRGVGLFVAEGARTRLRDGERKRFVEEEWPVIRDRMARLGISASDLMERERV